ncbi:acyltransferase [Novosphingobium sp. G106]|uniref:acyltransferase family protein n=1 Tax=Novosphingobium sp. G106 TaxID=2849500 RepID=UPI001C2D57E5|nr:acyltransferase [Novosphingobium sp. G106]MBV1686667.1 acyltransferase [Novosphingobium sp. G106]
MIAIDGARSATHKSDAASSRLPLLDGLRGIAAILVMLHHEPTYFGYEGLFPRAYLAVDFFFMLSGFVLTLSYEERLRTSSASGFLIFRICRLWPLLAVGIVMGAVQQFIWEPNHTSMVLAITAFSLLFLPVFAGNCGLYQLNGPQWSVTFELIANFVHAKFLSRLSDAQLLGFVGGSAVMLVLVGQKFGNLAIGDTVGNWWGGFFRVGFGYGLGVFFARRFGRSQPGTPLLWFWGLAIVPMILILLPVVPLPRAAGDCLAVLVLLPMAFWLAIRAQVGERFAGPLLLLGSISYPLYAIHVPVLAASRALAHGQPAETQLAIRAGSIAVIFVLSWALARSSLSKGIRLGRLPWLFQSRMQRVS